jgi:hypothetical protein
VAKVSPTPTVYDMTRPPCDAQSADAVVTTVSAIRDVHALLTFAPVINVPQSSRRLAARSTVAPPGAPPDSAFLNPLRV